MASKYWVVDRKKSKSPSVKGSLLEISTIIPETRCPEYLENLQLIEPYQDFQIEHNKNRERFSWDKHYEIYTGRKKLLLTGLQRNSIFCFCQDPYEKVDLLDLNNKIVLKIEKINFSGYISTKMHFAVSAGCKLGEIIRISDFLERPKYEIMDARGGLLFMSAAKHSDRNVTQDFHLIGKSGKTVHIQQEDGVLRMRIYQLCTVPEKAILLSLVLIMDLVGQSEPL